LNTYGLTVYQYSITTLLQISSLILSPEFTCDWYWRKLRLLPDTGLNMARKISA
jgi:hypothetical protein